MTHDMGATRQDAGPVHAARKTACITGKGSICINQFAEDSGAEPVVPIEDEVDMGVLP